MLKRGYLAASSVYVSMAHTSDIVTKYLKVADEVFSIIAKAVSVSRLNNLLDTFIFLIYHKKSEW